MGSAEGIEVGVDDFRRVMGHFATGVTVVTSRDGAGEPVGLTVNAFTSVSLDPLLVLVCLHREASAHDPLLESGHFAVNLLARDQEDLARRFAGRAASDRFPGVAWREGPLGSPLVDGALGWLECRVHEVYPGGDHSIIVGEVRGCGATGTEPLLFFRGELGGPRL